MECDYNLEIERAEKEIKKQKAKVVCLQFPDGLKQYALDIAKEIEGRTGAKCLVWLGSCFGACDLPPQSEILGADLIIQFGHSEWKKK